MLPDKKKKRESYNELRAIVIDFLRERDGDNCGICLEPIAYDDMGIDHIEQVSQGGRHEAGNVRLVHRACNRNRPRGKGVFKTSPMKTHCKHGHAFIKKNIYIRPNGSRECIPCRRARHKKKVTSAS